MAACTVGDGAPEAPWLTAPTPASHDRFFPVANGPHAVDCNSCHGPSDSFRGFTCTGCHTDQPTLGQHTGVSGYVWASPNCYACHPRGTGTLAPAEHARFFPIDSTDTHALGATFITSAARVTLACTTCHAGDARSDVTCTACHTEAGANATGPNPIDLGPAHATRLGGSNWHAATAPTPQCLSCHARDTLERVSTHGKGTAAVPSDAPGVTFTISSAAPGHFVACEKCHTATVATDPDLLLPHLDYAQRSCSACHSEAQDRLVTLHGRLSVAPAVTDTVDAQGKDVPGHARRCLACHPDGGAAPSTVSYTHAWFPISGSATHAMGAVVTPGGTISCASCHTALTTDPSQIDCTACHTDAQMRTSANVSFHAAVPDVTWPTPADPQGTSLRCLRCHADGAVPASVLVSTHSTHGVHAPSNANILFDILAGSPHDPANAAKPMACLTCHASTAVPDSAIPGLVVTDFTQQTCTACHLSTGTLHQDIAGLHVGVTTPSPGFVPVPAQVTPAYSKTCLVCHATGHVDPVVAAQNHASFFPIGTGSSHAFGKSVVVAGAPQSITCATCHVDPARRENVDCTTCHLQSVNNGTPGPDTPADQETAHAGLVSTVGFNGAVDKPWSGTGPVGIGSGATANCLRCHAADTQTTGFVARHGLAGPQAAVFHIEATNPDHFVSCELCHTATRTDPLRKNPQSDFAQASCDKCHDVATIPGEHQGFGAPLTQPFTAGDPNNATACLSCHQSGGTATGFTHTWFPVAASDVHRSAVARCADCHTTSASYSGTPANNLALIACTSCHNDTAASKPNQNGFTITAVHQSARVGKDIWDIPGGLDYATNTLCLKCHAGNVGGAVAAWSTPLVFRLKDHDVHCKMSDKLLLSGDNTHHVNRNADNGVNICFACHDATATSTDTPWGVDWSWAKPATSCKACHQHQVDSAPNITCK
ncbi:MAG: hypothetical protein JST92_05115 [Deltaproteobacteria bacterium]|nr:hypothetical protein [Deltaproteobacteria bacterium]